MLQSIWETDALFISETTRELLTHVPAGLKSELPSSAPHAIAADLATEAELTPLHMGAYSGSENVVRALLNSSGVQVDAATVPSVRKQSVPLKKDFFKKKLKSCHSNFFYKNKKSRDFNPYAYYNFFCTWVRTVCAVYVRLCTIYFISPPFS